MMGWVIKRIGSHEKEENKRLVDKQKEGARG